MSVTHQNIPGRPEPQGFSHISIATGSRIVYIAGQTGSGSDGAVVEGGLAAQTEQALLNLAEALETAGATVDDVAKVNFYVVDWEPSMFEAFGQGAAAAGEKYQFTSAATTLVGVKSLFEPAMLIEVEAVAVLD